MGYLVSDSGLPLDTAALKARLAEQLPPHMVPVVLMQLAELPLSANGKLDRKALPLPTLGGERSGRPPEPGMETLVAAVFSQLLGCEVNDIDADFFALGGHSLLAMRPAAQLSRQLARQVTPGQVMVASTVGKLSALLAADLSDEQARRTGAGYASAAARERRSDAVLLPSGLRLRPAVQRAGALSQPALVNYRYSVAAPAGADGQRRQPRRGLRASSANAVGAAAARPLLPVRVFVGRHLSPGDCRPLAPARRSGGLPRPAGYPRPPETQNWAEKEANGLDPEVLAEIDREREAFLAAQQGQASGELFSAIEGNYADAVRLLTTAHSAKFDGKATLFVAEKTRQEGMDPQVVWGPWVGGTGGVQPELRPRRYHLPAGL